MTLDVGRSGRTASPRTALWGSEGGWGKGSPSADVWLYAGDRTKGPLLLSPADNDFAYDNVTLAWNFSTTAGTPRLRLEDFRAFKIDEELLDGLAEQEYQAPTLTSVRIELPGERAPMGVANVVNVDGELAEDLRVTSLQYSVSGEQGARTFVTVGPRTVSTASFLPEAARDALRPVFAAAQNKALRWHSETEARESTSVARRSK